MAIKNYRSEMPIGKIFDSIAQMLVSHGARQLIFEYRNDGKAVGLTFIIETPRGSIPIKLPARIERVAKVMEDQRADGWRNPAQVYRTAWKNIHDWIDAQMALLETEMAQLQEVFLPYMVDRSGKTFFEHMEDKGFMLENGDSINN